MAPVIHLPERNLGRNGDDAEGQDDAAGGEGGAQKRSTRRGSRGGRNRRKPAGATATETDAPTEAATEVVATAEPEGEWTYTPMSEWDQS